MKKKAQFLARIAADKVPPGVSFHEGGGIVLHRADTGEVRACRNRCRHQGGLFSKHEGCVVRCAKHGWRMDAASMSYVNPAGGLEQPELLVEMEGGELAVYEPAEADPWGADLRDPAPISRGELQIRFYAHACMEILFGGKSFFTDPWLMGPAFSRGWWLLHEPPANWRERLAAADGIYISHNHTDHLNEHTLGELLKLNPDARIFVPKFPSDSCRPRVESLGFRNVVVPEFGEWVDLSPDARFMILQDAAGRDDSGLLFEYKGHRILDTVDCANLNGGRLPGATVLLSSFAGGATGFPVCWGELHSEEWISSYITRKIKAYAQYAVHHAEKVRPKVFVPFAGYFTEAHPSDADIKRMNRKNNPNEVAALVELAVPEARSWVPQPGEVLDLAALEVVERHEFQAHRDYDFPRYEREIRRSLDFAPLQSREGLLAYFKWAGFRADDLVLHVIETDENFGRAVREFYVDFSGPIIADRRPQRPHRYERMKVRADVFRHVLMRGLPWEEISIGFQARFFRDPDVYNFDFWSHFQNRLPTSKPF